MKHVGKIYLVGAGPGDPGLITVKALKYIRQADVIVYDRLIPREILSYRKSKAVLKYVGKEKGNTFDQEKINRMLLDYVEIGKCVVRLKGGDPFVFGRGQEEADFLRQRGIACEIIPGVSSCYAVPEVCGISLTDRRFSSGFMVLTGHEDAKKNSQANYWNQAAKFSGTIVIMMGLSNLKEITDKLMAKGKSGKALSAVIANGTTKRQKIVTGTLSNIADKSKGLRSPAICVIGDVVGVGLYLNPLLKPLDKKKYLTTASEALNQDMAKSLQNLGASVQRLPMIKIVPSSSTVLLDKIIADIKTFDWLVFTSRHGVHYFLKRYFSLKAQINDLAGRVACVGPSTTAEFSKYRIKADLVPKKFTTKDLGLALVAAGVAGKKIALLRTYIKPDHLKKALVDQGAQVTDCQVYGVEESQDKKSLARAIAKKPDGIFFLSPKSAHRFFELVPDRIKERLKNNSAFLSIGPVTTAALKAQGVSRIKAAKVHTVQGLVGLCLEEN